MGRYSGTGGRSRAIFSRSGWRHVHCPDGHWTLAPSASGRQASAAPPCGGHQCRRRWPRGVYWPGSRAWNFDQQLVGALVGCLSADFIVLETPIMRRDQETMICFEALLERRSTDGPSLAEIGVALGVSQPVLHRYCRMHLGMSSSQLPALPHHATPASQGVKRNPTPGRLQTPWRFTCLKRAVGS